MSFIYMPIFTRLGATTNDPPIDERGRFYNEAMLLNVRQTLEDDPVGTVSISLNGVKEGSEIKIFNVNRELLAGTEAASGLPSFTLQRYTIGSPRNTVRILIASLGFENLDLDYELPNTDSSIPVFQRKDRNYRNPN